MIPAAERGGGWVGMAARQGPGPRGAEGGGATGQPGPPRGPFLAIKLLLIQIQSCVQIFFRTGYEVEINLSEYDYFIHYIHWSSFSI